MLSRLKGRKGMRPSEFRSFLVHQTLHLYPLISWETAFLAVKIFDNYLHAITEKGKKFQLRRKNIVCAIVVCLHLAEKVLGKKQTQIQSVLQTWGVDQYSTLDSHQYFWMEGLILAELKWTISSVTPFSIVAEHLEKQGKLSNDQLLLSKRLLKCLLAALRYSHRLSNRLDYAHRLYYFCMDGRKDEELEKYLSKIKSCLECGHLACSEGQMPDK